MIKSKNHTLGSTAGAAYSFIAMTMIICVVAFIIIVLVRDGAGVLAFYIRQTEPVGIGCRQRGYPDTNHRHLHPDAAGNGYILSICFGDGNIFELLC